MRCSLISSEEHFGIVKKNFAKCATEFCLRPSLERYQNFFRDNAIEFRLYNNLDTSWNNLDQMQLKFGSDTN